MLLGETRLRKIEQQVEYARKEAFAEFLDWMTHNTQRSDKEAFMRFLTANADKAERTIVGEWDAATPEDIAIVEGVRSRLPVEIIRGVLAWTQPGTDSVAEWLRVEFSARATQTKATVRQ